MQFFKVQRLLQQPAGWHANSAVMWYPVTHQCLSYISKLETNNNREKKNGLYARKTVLANIWREVMEKPLGGTGDGYSRRYNQQSRLYWSCYDCCTVEQCPQQTPWWHLHSNTNVHPSNWGMPQGHRSHRQNFHHPKAESNPYNCTWHAHAQRPAHTDLSSQPC